MTLSILRNPTMNAIVRLLMLLTFAAAPCAAAMDFRVAGNELHVSGRVVGDELALLKDVEAAHPNAIDTVVFRNSPGGDAWTGYRVGERIRDNGWRTVVIGACVSACTLMYLGGRHRHFGETTRPERVFLAFHGPSSGDFIDDHAVSPRGRPQIRRWILERTGGKADAALLERFVNNEKRADLMRFYDPRQLARSDGVSVLFCPAAERKGADPFDACEKIAGHDALSMGFVTSEERVRVTPPARLPPPFRFKLPESPK
jgi:hypothetical protein